jgi:hypothetical protein
MERYIHTDIQNDMAFFSAYAIISFALRARKKHGKCGKNKKWLMEMVNDRPYVQYLPKVWERAREPYGKRRFSRRSQKSNFLRISLNFFLS